MNCLECQEMLQRRLDGESCVSAELDQHLALCSACRDQHALAQRLLDGLAALPHQACPLDFAQRMTNRVLLERSLRWRRLALRITVATALAASVLFLFLSGFLSTPKTPEQPQPIVQPKEIPPEPQALSKSMEDAKNAVASLTGKLADGTKKQAEMLLAAASPGPVEMPPSVVGDPLEPAAGSLKQAGQTVAQVAQGLEPVARTAQRAWHYFLREMPLVDITKN